MAATFHHNGQPIVRWTRSQLETMSRANFRDRINDLAAAVGEEHPPRHREVAVEWMLEMQDKLPEAEVPAEPEAAAFARTSRLQTEDRRPHDAVLAETGAVMGANLDPIDVAQRAREKNRGYGDLLMMGSQEPQRPHSRDPQQSVRIAEPVRSAYPPAQPAQGNMSRVGDTMAHTLRAAEMENAYAELPSMHGFDRAGLRPSATPGSPGSRSVLDTASTAGPTEAAKLRDTEANRSYWKRNTQGAGNLISWS